MATTQNTYTGNGSLTEYSFTFPYLEESDVRVSLDGVDQLTTAYSFANATTISFNTAPGNGVAIRIYRQTAQEAPPATFFAGSAIRASDLNDNFLQQLYVAQETDNIARNLTAGDIAPGAIGNVQLADDAVTAAKIADSNVTTAKINTAAVTAAKIADANITTAKIADANITTAKIADSNVTTAKLADGSVTAVKLAAGAAVPSGAIFYFAASTAPTGYLKANGDIIPNGSGTVQGVTADFSALYAVIGSTYGSAGQLPDLRGEFIRGWDDSRGVDSGRSFGSSQDHQLQNHSHTQTYAVHPSATGAEQEQAGSPDSRTNFGATKQTSDGSTAGDVGSFGSETRPRNVALLACIKY